MFSWNDAVKTFGHWHVYLLYIIIFTVLYDINMLTDATHGMVWSKTGEPYQYDMLSHWGAVNDENLQTAIAQDALFGKMLTNGTCKSLRGLYIITFGGTRGGDKMRLARRTMFFSLKAPIKQDVATENNTCAISVHLNFPRSILIGTVLSAFPKSLQRLQLVSTPIHGAVAKPFSLFLQAHALKNTSDAQKNAIINAMSKRWQCASVGVTVLRIFFFTIALISIHLKSLCPDKAAHSQTRLTIIQGPPGTGKTHTSAA